MLSYPPAEKREIEILREGIRFWKSEKAVVSV
jgi:hypothetical protein